MYRISSASLPQPSPRSQFRSMVVIVNLKDMKGKHENDNLKGRKVKAWRSTEEANAGAKPTEITLECGLEAFGFFDRDEVETDSVIRPKLGEQRKIR